MAPIRVALLGGGSVGAQVARLLRENADDLAQRIGAPVELTAVAVRDASKARPDIPAHLITTDAAGPWAPAGCSSSSSGTKPSMDSMLM